MNVTSNKRLLALDVMRGITIAGMILVNNPGSWDMYIPLLNMLNGTVSPPQT